MNKPVATSQKSDQNSKYSSSYRNIAEEIRAMPAWKQEVYNNLFATSAHAQKIELAKNR